MNMMPGPPGPLGSGKIYPPNQPMVFNPSNPNAPPIYPCGGCHKEVKFLRIVLNFHLEGKCSYYVVLDNIF